MLVVRILVNGFIVLESKLTKPKTKCMNPKQVCYLIFGWKEQYEHTVRLVRGVRNGINSATLYMI